MGSHVAEPPAVRREDIDQRAIGGARPRRSAVDGAIEPVEEADPVRIDGVHHIGLRVAQADPDAAAVRRRRGQTAPDQAPGVAAVGGGMDRAPRTTVVVEPRLSNVLPHRREDHVRVVGAKNEVDAAGLIIHVQDPLPGGCRRPLSGRRRAPGSACQCMPLAATKMVSGSLGWMTMRPMEPLLSRPTRVQVVALVGGAEETGAAVGDAASTRIHLAGAGVDHVRVAGVDGHRADGERRHLVEERGPGLPRVDGAEDAALSRAGKDDLSLFGSTARSVMRPGMFSGPRGVQTAATGPRARRDSA